MQEKTIEIKDLIFTDFFKTKENKNFSLNGRKYRVVLSYENYWKALNKMGGQIVNDFQGLVPTVVGFDVGGGLFARNLSMILACYRFPHYYETMRSTAYDKNVTVSQKEVNILGLPKKEFITNRYVIACDDIFDTSKTYFKAKNILNGMGAKSIHPCMMIVKNVNNVNIDIKYSLIPAGDLNAWYVGMGLNGPAKLGEEDGRHLPFVCLTYDTK